MVIVETSTTTFLHFLMYGGELFQFLRGLQPVRVPSVPRANVTPCAVVVSYSAMTQAMAFGVHHSHEQNAKHGAAPGLQACLSVLFHRGKDAFGFGLLFRQEHFMALMVFSFWGVVWRSALFLLFSFSRTILIYKRICFFHGHCSVNNYHLLRFLPLFVHYLSGVNEVMSMVLKKRKQ